MTREAAVARPPVCVRRAQVQDIDDLLLMWSRARDDLVRTVRNLSGTSVEQVRPRLHDALSHPAVRVLVAHVDGQAAGYVVATIASVNPLLDGLNLQIEHLYVAPDFRRRGVAKALMTKVTAVAEANGCDQVLANVAPHARDSHRFLARLGFAPLVVRRVVPTAALRRRLSGQTRRGGLEDLLSLRRSQRARTPRLRGGPVVAPQPRMAAEGTSARAADARTIDVTPPDRDGASPRANV